MTLEHLPLQLLELALPLRDFSPPALKFNNRVYSPWHDGSLAPLLTARGVSTLIVSGLETEVCVFATVLGAIDYGFRVVIAMDAVCSSADETYDAMSRIYKNRFGTQVEAAQTSEIIEAWQDKVMVIGPPEFRNGRMSAVTSAWRTASRPSYCSTLTRELSAYLTAKGQGQGPGLLGSCRTS